MSLARNPTLVATLIGAALITANYTTVGKFHINKTGVDYMTMEGIEMNKRFRFVLWTTILTITLVAQGVPAQSQRLGIPAQNFSIQPKASQACRGYCMDYGVPAPKPGTPLSHILTDGSQVEVVIGDKPPISLPEAIRQGHIQLEAKERYRGTTFDEVVKDSSLEQNERLFLQAIKDRAIFDGLYDKLRKAALSDADEIVEAYAKDRQIDGDELEILRSIGVMLSQGDGEHVVFRNNTDKEIDIRIKRATLVGEHPGKTTDLPIALEIPVATDDADHAQNAQQIWLNNSSIHASLSAKDADRYLESEEARAGISTFSREGNRTFVYAEDIYFPSGGRLVEPELRIVEGQRILEVIQGEAATVQFSSHLAKRAADMSNEDNSVVMVNRNIEGRESTIQIHVGKESIEMSTEEFEDWMQNGNISESIRKRVEGDPKRNLIVWRDPLTRLTEKESQAELTALVCRLQEIRQNVYLDDDLKASQRRLATMPSISGPEDIAVLSDASSFIDDRGVIDAIEDDLKLMGIRVYDVSMNALRDQVDVHEPNVILLTGHKDEAFRAHLRALAASGALKDHLVVAFSCYQFGDEELNSEIFRSPNAPKAICFFSEELDAGAVQDVLHFVGEAAKDIKDSNPEDMRKLLEESVRRALGDKDTPGRLKPEIKKLQNPVIQISSIDNELRDVHGLVASNGN